MKYVTGLLFFSLFFAGFSYGKTSESINTTEKRELNSVIDCVASGEHTCIDTSLNTAESLTLKDSIRLRKALAHSLITHTNNTLVFFAEVDKRIAERGHSAIRDNAGTDSVCAYMVDSSKYDRVSFFKYYFIAKTKLEKTGAKGKACLELMDASVEEIIYEEKAGKMIWGNSQYPF